jgi:hypothetical protein
VLSCAKFFKVNDFQRNQIESIGTSDRARVVVYATSGGSTTLSPQIFHHHIFALPLNFTPDLSRGSKGFGRSNLQRIQLKSFTAEKRCSANRTHCEIPISSSVAATN